MLEKDPGQPKIHHLRMIHLYEADYNLILAVKWRQLLHLACNNGFVNPSLFGSQPGKEALDAVENLLEPSTWDDPVVQSRSSKFLSNVLYSVATVDDKSMAAVAEAIVERAISEHNITPDISVYNALLHCWSKVDRFDTGARVLSILSQLEDDPGYHPDVSTYNNVLVALRGGPSGGLTAAEEIVQRMEQHGPKPTVQVYTALVMNYARYLHLAIERPKPPASDDELRAIEVALGPIIDVALAARVEVRAAKRYDLSDMIRDGLAAAGVEVRDTPDGQVWELTAQ